MKIYAMSDIHGKIDIFKENLERIDLDNDNNKLILLGDYLDRNNYEDIRVIELIIKLQEKYKDRVIALMGNHELYLLDDYNDNKIIVDENIIKWIKSLPYYHQTPAGIFVHAGIDEEANEYWHLAVEDYYYCNKYPHTIGEFSKDIIAGHISAYEISVKEGKPVEKGDIYYDGKSHYYIDGESENSNIIPILIYDEDIKKYSKIINKKKVEEI